MKILSLFDGISCARVALERAGIPVEAYYASEIEQQPMQISRRNWPDIIQMGDVKEVHMLEPVDLLIGGSPCQDLSVAKAGRKGLAGERSGLFYEYVRILKETKPKWFVLENVASMSKESRDAITAELGVQPIMIDAALVSAQSRRRLFWTNIPGVCQPHDREIYLKDILEEGGFTERDKSYPITATYWKMGKSPRDYLLRNKRQVVFNRPIQVTNRGTGNGMSTRVYSILGKSVTLKALGGAGGAKTGLYIVGKARGKNAGYVSDLKAPTLTSSSWEYNNFLLKLEENGYTVRSLTPVECERLQSLPDGYTEGVAKTARIKALGNGFNAEVITHILKHLPDARIGA